MKNFTVLGGKKQSQNKANFTAENAGFAEQKEKNKLLLSDLCGLGG